MFAVGITKPFVEWGKLDQASRVRFQRIETRHFMIFAIEDFQQFSGEDRSIGACMISGRFQKQKSTEGLRFRDNF